MRYYEAVVFAKNGHTSVIACLVDRKKEAENVYCYRAKVKYVRSFVSCDNKTFYFKGSRDWTESVRALFKAYLDSDCEIDVVTRVTL